MTSRNLEQLNRIAEAQGKPFKILIVDDEPWVREVFQDFCNLTSAFTVDMASSGAEALDKIDQSSYDLITIDLIMPEMSGLDTLIKIKQKVPKVPVMVITGNATEKLIKQAGIDGACRVMYKPLMLEDFLGGIAATLTR